MCTRITIISLEAFTNLVEMSKYAQQKLMPLDEFQEQFKQALKEVGYDSQEKIINLVQEVKQKMATECQSQKTTKKVAND